MDFAELFQGIAIIFDDELSDSESTIYKIKQIIQNRNIPVAVYNEMPREEIIPALSNASFVILDWDYNSSDFSIAGTERVSVAAELLNEQESDLIKFIRKLLDSIFIPVFIFTSKPEEEIKNILSEEGIWNKDQDNRIFIKQKNDIITEFELFNAIENWVKAMPSVYVLKKWEKEITKSKDNMFIELYKYSPNWVKIVWEMLKDDTIENHREFGEFITRNLNNRIGTYAFDEEIICVEKDYSRDELRKVIQGERYFVYDNIPEQVYTGDLFKIRSDYYLNIRAQCDLSRRDTNGNYNPSLYCIKGEKIRNNDIVAEDIKITDDGYLDFGNERILLADVINYCKQEKEEELQKVNRKITKHKNKNFFHKGTFLERNDKVIVGCVAGEKALQFNLNIEIKELNDIKDKRIGRILPPYITRIQMKCAQHMIREGTMAIPESCFFER
jgi:hypothetical protein